MAPWRVIARSFPPAPHNPDIALGGLQRPPSPDTRSTEDPGSPALARPEPCASAARIRHTEIPYEQACAAPIISASCSLRRSPADTPDTRPSQNRRPLFVRHPLSIAKNADPLNPRQLPRFTNSRGQPYCPTAHLQEVHQCIK